MAPKNTRLENQILHFSQQGKWDKVEALWPQVVEEPSINPKFYATIARRLLKAEKIDDLKSWIMLVVEMCNDAGGERQLIQLCRGVLLAYPEFEELREPLTKALKAFYSSHPNVDQYIDDSGLNHEAALNQPLNKFFQYVACSPGQVYSHKDWGAGEVVDLNPREGRVKIRFFDGREHDFSFEGVKEYLEKVPRSHLFARRILDPEALRQEAEDKPVEFMLNCLKSLGGSANRARLKDELTQGVFDSRGWNKWWGQNRDAFRVDPFIGFSGPPSNPTLERRTEPKPFHEEVLEAFRKVLTFADRYSLVQDLLNIKRSDKTGEGYEVPDEVLGEVQTALEKALGEVPADQPAQRIEYLCLLEEVRTARGAESDNAHIREAVEAVQKVDNPLEIIGPITVPDYQMQVAAWLRDASGENWPQVGEEIFLSGSARLGQWVLRDMIEQGHKHEAEHMAEQLLHRPYENTDLFLWLVRTVRESRLPELEVEVEPTFLVSSVLELLADCRQRVDHEDVDSTRLRGLMTRLETLLAADHHSLMTELFESYETEEARRRYLTHMECNFLSESFKVSLDHALRAVRHDLEEAAAGDTQEHLVTAESLERKQKEYRQLKSVDIPANSKAIGAAAALGDLSENAEYESAKERQKVLFRRLEALEDQLNRARVVVPEAIDTATIGFGTHFQIRNMDSGETEEYSMLGLWDADPDQHVLSYETPFGKQFLNRKAGEILIVTHPGGGSTQYKVLAISNAMAAS